MPRSKHILGLLPVTFALVLMVFPAIFAGCTFGRRAGNGLGGDDEMEVRFEVRQQQQQGLQEGTTKVTGQNFDAGDEISVFAAAAGQGITAAVEGRRDKRYLANNANEFSAVDGNQIQYGSRDERLDFFVFYPAVGAAGEEVNVADCTVGIADVRDQRGLSWEPYMYSNNARDVGVEGNGGATVVGLNFKYIVSKVSVNVQFDTEKYATLDDIVFYATGLKQGVVIDLGRDDAATLAMGDATSAEVEEGNPILLPLPVDQMSELVFYLPPGQVSAPTFKITFTKTPTEGGGVEDIYAVVDAGNYTFAAGKAYRYSVRAGFENNGPVTVGGKIEDWVPVSGAPTIPAGRK